MPDIVSSSSWSLGQSTGFFVCWWSASVWLHCLVPRLLWCPLLWTVWKHRLGRWRGKTHPHFTLGWTQPRLLTESGHLYNAEKTWQSFGAGLAFPGPQSWFCCVCVILVSAGTSQLDRDLAFQTLNMYKWSDSQSQSIWIAGFFQKGLFPDMQDFLPCLISEWSALMQTFIWAALH